MSAPSAPVADQIAVEGRPPRVITAVESPHQTLTDARLASDFDLGCLRCHADHGMMRSISSASAWAAATSEASCEAASIWSSARFRRRNPAARSRRAGRQSCFLPVGYLRVRARS